MLRRADSRPVTNTILTRIPDEDFCKLSPHLKWVELDLDDYLERHDQAVEHVYFLNTGIASLLLEMSQGQSVEVGIVGRETMVGLPALSGFKQLSFGVIVQVPGAGFKMSATHFNEAVGGSRQLHDLLMRHLAIRSFFLAQNVGCNRLHSVEQRLARWLMVTYDRLDTNRISTTHDFLSRMVGTDRATVSLALAALEGTRALKRSRGAITILDAKKLEQLCCECYMLFKSFNSELGLGR